MPSYQYGNRLYTRVLDTVGDGSGDILVNGDYSTTPKEFKLHALGDAQLEVVSAAYYWRMPGTSIFAGGYGTGAAPLANGIEAFIRHDGVVVTHFMAGGRVTTNSGWSLSGYRIHEHPGIVGLGPIAAYSVGFDFRQTWGNALFLEAGKDELVFVFNDDFRTFTEHLVVIHGYDRRKHEVIGP